MTPSLRSLFVLWLGLLAAPALAAPPKTVLVNLENKHYAAAITAVDDGDIIKICNLDRIFHKPFSLSSHNRFNMTLKPQECGTIVARNPTKAPLRLALFDDLHAMEKLDLVVAPARTFTGNWKTEWGTLTMSQTDDVVSGHYDFQGGSVAGKVKDGVLAFTWSQSGNGHKGTGTFILAKDGKSFSGTWQRAPDQEKLGPGGAWNGTLID